MLPIFVFLGVAYADTSEISARVAGEVRYGAVDRPDPRTDAVVDGGSAFAYGGSVLVGLGLDFHWTITLRYGFDTTGQLLRTSDHEAQIRDGWTADRHAVLAGAAWALSDQLTPVVLVEAGATHTTLREIAERVGADQAIGETRAAHVSVKPGGRLTLGYEWRFLDFWSLTGSVSGEYADGLGVLGGVWLSGYRYTSWY